MNGVAVGVATFVAMDEARVVMSTATATDEGALVAVDVETGAREWSGLPGLTAVNGVGVHDGELTVVAETAARATPAIMTVSLEDGSLQSEEPTKVVDWGCRPAVDTVVVCSLPGERAVVQADSVRAGTRAGEVPASPPGHGRTACIRARSASRGPHPCPVS